LTNFNLHGRENETHDQLCLPAVFTVTITRIKGFAVFRNVFPLWVVLKFVGWRSQGAKRRNDAILSFEGVRKLKLKLKLNP